jgi:hypothetical protein
VLKHDRNMARREKNSVLERLADTALAGQHIQDKKGGGRRKAIDVTNY